MKCGIEIHQRLDTLKLFCRCPSVIHEGDGDGELVRHLHPVASELGELDVTAQFEYLKRKEYHYRIYGESTCLVEADEEPPNRLNEDALRIALEIALMLHAQPVDELHIMRKTVVDGSNTGGFQRTCLLARGGFVETGRGKVNIQTICLEEESSGIAGEEGEKVFYKLDRLGIPLIEIATAPEIIDAEHARETAEKLGSILRATGKVLRGLGTIRQDVNVSVEGGVRVEIKGAQELAAIPKMIWAEVKRQTKLIEVQKELVKRNAKLGRAEVVDVSRAFANTESKLVRKVFETDGKILAVKLEKFAGILGTELYPNRRFGTEMSDYAKAASGVGGIIHSDEDLKKYAFSDAEIADVKGVLGVSEGDAFVMVAAEEGKARMALSSAYARAKDALGQLHEEVRKVMPDGVSSSYMRPMPGAARLYPETDLGPIRITKKLVEEVGKGLAEMPEVKLAKLKKMLNGELAEKIMRSRNLALFEKLLSTEAEPSLIATTLEETIVALRREGMAVDEISDEKMMELLEGNVAGLFVKAAIPEILRELAKDSRLKVVDIVMTKGWQRLKGAQLADAIKRELGETKEIGKVMAKFRLRAEAGDVKAAVGL